MPGPFPVKSEVRFSARVDYFLEAEEAAQYAARKRAAGFNVNGGGSIEAADLKRESAGPYEGFFPIHWIDRPGQGFYG